ncbi:hypothetical protein PCASD_04908 [Puccinia coronata f. sp. avenae]|uniref:No apical meristem-associated C-terminal domain-containing protein n=1 Tax=Puccinia coronata f. sp. avenae TaxID=200324 RepID=A0A2N5VD79_9BASI|nr:hypothetical protein PCASD_04908 [Puccinia coronata f. sp. avenae]
MVPNCTPTTPSVNPTKQDKKKPISWERDGVNGGDSSSTIVLNWISSDNNYERWRGDTEHRKTKKSLASEVLEILKENRITQRINYLQTSYNQACYWKQNTGAGILETDLINGVKTVEDQLRTICCHWDILDPIMGSRSVAEPLYTRSSMSAAENAQEDAPRQPSSNPPLDLDLSSGQNINNIKDAEESQTPTPALASQKKKNKKKKSLRTSRKGKSTRVAKSKAKKNPEDIFMRSMMTKRQAEMMKARAEVSKAKLNYMKGLKEMGVDFEDIKKMAEKEFPVPINFLNESESDSSDSSDDD